MRPGLHPGKLHESDAVPATSASLQLLCSNRADSPCRLPACGWYAADLGQLKSECLDLGRYAVQRGLIRGASQRSVLTCVLLGVRHHRPGDQQSGGRAIRRALRLFVLVFASSTSAPAARGSRRRRSCRCRPCLAGYRPSPTPAARGSGPHCRPGLPRPGSSCHGERCPATESRARTRR